MRPATSAPEPAESYHADLDFWSKSMLSTFRSRRRLAEALYVTRTQAAEPPSAAMRLGTLVHTALLEPHALAEKFVEIPKLLLSPDGGIRSKLAKEFVQEQEEAGLIVMKPDDLTKLQAIVMAVKNKVGDWLEAPSYRERVFRWHHEETKLPLKCRPDWLIRHGSASIVLDIKTCSDASPHAFASSCAAFDYWMQDVHYSAGVRSEFGTAVDFFFIAVETEFPFACAVYQLKPEQRQDSEAVWLDTLQDLRGCLKSGDWRESWEKDINTIPLKPWTFYRQES